MSGTPCAWLDGLLLSLALLQEGLVYLISSNTDLFVLLANHTSHFDIYVSIRFLHLNVRDYTSRFSILPDISSGFHSCFSTAISKNTGLRTHEIKLLSALIRCLIVVTLSSSRRL